MNNYIELSKQIAQEASLVQHQAAHPEAAVWVSAAAGTGKTHILTQRLLRLLLQHPHLPASRILAITYTKAAAAEMRLRLFDRLSHWVYADETQLQQMLDSLLDRPSTEEERRHARTLYARLVDDPAGIGISTIHSFCEQILRQFPLEAGLTPGFTVLDNADEAALLTRAVSQSLTEAATTQPETLALVAEAAGDKALYAWLTRLVQGDEGRRLQRYLGQFADMSAAEDHLSSLLNININTPPSIALTMADIPLPLCRHLLKAWAGSGKTGDKLAAQLQRVMAAPHPARWEDYQRLWLTKELTPKAEKTLFTKEAKSRLDEATLAAAFAEQQRILKATHHLAAWHSFTVTRAVMRLAHDALQQYKRLKNQRAAVDFADLIHETHRLLHTPGLQDWVRFRLDRRIHHILLDEAQDTDQDQWAILRAFTDEFYAGLGQHDEIRTLFAVGDVKQSIYRFRGAAPEVFAGIRPYLAEKTAAVNHSFRPLSMTTSFRSAPAVLRFVDEVFAQPTLRTALDPQLAALTHQPHKAGSGGVVELWPPLPAEPSTPDTTPWQPPRRQPPPLSAETQVYTRVAQKIREMINGNVTLGTLGRPAELGDILILVRNRTSLGQLIAALDAAGLPHTGADRLHLQQTPALQDMVALGWTLHNPGLDLPLVHTLRGSFFGLTDAELDHLKNTQAQQRLPTLWAALTQATTAPLAGYYHTLKAWRDLAAHLTPAALYRQILQQHQGRARLLRRFGHATTDLGWVDPIDTFLTLAEDFGRKEITGLPGFLNWFTQQDTAHKKETSASQGQIRVMSIHGAKGLEAPVVFLPDLLTPQTNRGQSTYWCTPEGASQPTLVIYPGGLKIKAIADEEEAEKHRRTADDARLLYVALTRARDQLYIGGTLKRGGQVHEDSLYGLLKNSVIALGATEDEACLRYAQPLQQTYPTQAGHPPVQPDIMASLPAFTRQPAGREKTRRPKRASHGQSASLNTPPPPPGAQQAAMSRGQHLHRLLELMSGPALADPAAQGQRYLRQFAPDLDSATSALLLQQATDVITHYPWLFAPDSRPEVALRAVLEDKIINARIDRLRVTADEVQIIDFKSDANPSDERRTAYAAQLSTYREAVAQIYKNHTIRMGILWTAQPNTPLTWLDNIT